MVREALAFCRQAIDYALSEAVDEEQKKEHLAKALVHAGIALEEPERDEPAKAAYIEILEKGRTTDDTPGGTLVIPNEVRINGTRLLVPAGETIEVHGMKLSDGDVVCVTLTLFARRVTVAAEGDL
jgi:hypothetical protein